MHLQVTYNTSLYHVADPVAENDPPFILAITSAAGRYRKTTRIDMITRLRNLPPDHLDHLILTMRSSNQP
jgi:hypothetical protein